MNPQIDDPSGLPELAWQNAHMALKQYLSIFAEQGSQRFIGNLETKVMALAAQNVTLPVTVNQTGYGNCYVCSPYTAYCDYAREETRLIPSLPLRGVLKAASTGAGRLLKAARFNDVVYINNWMLSTNLYPDIDSTIIPEITEAAVTRFPDHFICWRSLNRATDGPLIEALEKYYYTLLPSRQVYIFDRSGNKWRKTYDARNDRSLLNRSSYRVEDPIKLEECDFERAAELYRMLYLEKYSRLNPRFTPEFFRLCQESGAMRFIGLRSREGVVDGIIGQFTVGSVTTTPIVGYETTLPQNLGLYRMLTALILESSVSRGLTVNSSSGAASFKRMRGGEPATEYTAVYSKHLAFARRLGVSAFACGIRNAVLPVMKNLKL